MRLYFPRTSRKIQRTLKKLRVSILCFLLTFLVLRNTIGAGKFGTPAQDFQQIKLHLRNVALYRRHSRVLSEETQEEKPPSTARAICQTMIAFSTESDGGVTSISQKDSVLFTASKRREPLSDESTGESIALHTMKQKLEGAAADVERRDLPFRRERNGLEAKEFARTTKMDNPMRYRSHQQIKLLLIQVTHCEVNPRIFFKSVQNKVHYSTLHDLQVSISPACRDPRYPGNHSLRLAQLDRAMMKHPHAEWLWWMPQTSFMITDVSFKLPLDKYSKFNIILFGKIGITYTRDFSVDLNVDTFLIRNCQWSFAYLKYRTAVNEGRSASMSGDVLSSSITPRRSDADVNVNLFQGVLSGHSMEEFGEMMHVEKSRVLHGYWQDIEAKLEPLTVHTEQRLPFITHILDCQGGSQGRSYWREHNCLEQMERIPLLYEKPFSFE
ncbi:hypothetical protein KP509_01G060500 [Ceratopteris richardii]|uniref:Uncharacterized protein n=1 Tax=Ceratopteris richardii TaxID=49495 RepID=A0A8T2VDI5_CERRI|nr:hypothetical protein KP509_01G060500 [Ceratopteris richardii]